MATLSIQKVSSAGRPAGGRAGQASQATLPLAEREDGELLRVVRSHPLTSRRRADACEQLIARYRHLVLSCAQRYARGPELMEDLIQVGYVGLMKAINNFDPEIGGSLAAYAQPCIAGEIKRHFRDKRWQVHVKRPVKELALQIRDATESLTWQLGRAPSEADLAQAVNASEADMRQARLAALALQPLSLDAPMTDRPGTVGLADLLGHDDPNVEKLLDLQAVATHWNDLPRRQQRILVMRFYGGMTQAQIGAHLGISQMQVSRLLAHALGYLRERILGLDEAELAPAA